MDNTEKIAELIKSCEVKYNREYHRAYYKRNRLKLREKYYKKKALKMEEKVETFRQFLKKQEMENTIN
jgi:hypothetical protein